MKTVTVLPLQKGIFKDELTYFSTQEIEEGSIVSVLLRNKKILGLTTSSEDVSLAKGRIKGLDFDLKKIVEVKGKSVFREEFLSSAIEASKYFASKKGEVISSFIPAAFKEDYDKISKAIGGVNKEKVPIFKSNIRAEKLLFQAPFEDRVSYYKTLIRESFARKKSIFIVLPTEHDIETLFISLSKGIENFVIPIHGGLSAKKQIEKCIQVIDSSHPVLILGTTPYLSIPRHDIETIIIENESSSAYKTIGRAHYDLRIFAEIFAVKSGSKLIFSDTLLRFETIAKKDIENLGEVRPLLYRINFNGTIEIPQKGEKFKVLTDESVKEIQNTIHKSKNVFIFSLRRGLATMTVCRDCGETLLCDNCLAPVVLYLSRDGNKRMFICNKCGTERSPDTTCSRCYSWNLMPLGIGTDTVREKVENMFDKNVIFQLDKETVKSSKQAGKVIAEFKEKPGSILIGTEMALFYIKEKVPLSVIGSFDSLWSIPNFKMSERIIQLLISIISITEKKLIIETKNENDPAISAILNENLLSFVREELKDRRNLGYPPYKRFIKITFLGDKDETINAKNFMNDFLKDYNPEIFSGFLAKQKNKYVTNALIKLEPKKWSIPFLSANSSIDDVLLEKLLSLPPTFSISIDPEDLL